VIVLKKIKIEEPGIEIVISVPKGIEDRFEKKGIVIEKTESGSFAHFPPTCWWHPDNSCDQVKARVEIPYALFDEKIFIDLSEYIRLNEDGGLQELQTVCRDDGYDLKPLHVFKGNDQDRPRSVVFDDISVDFRKRIVVIRSELVNGRYFLSIFGLKAERVEYNQIMLTAQCLYESYVREVKSGYLETATMIPEAMELWYGKAINSHLAHLKSNLKIFRGRINLAPGQVIKLGSLA
jgi:hypothetical protein